MTPCDTHGTEHPSLSFLKKYIIYSRNNRNNPSPQMPPMHTAGEGKSRAPLVDKLTSQQARSNRHHAGWTNCCFTILNWVLSSQRFLSSDWNHFFCNFGWAMSFCSFFFFVFLGSFHQVPWKHLTSNHSFLLGTKLTYQFWTTDLGPEKNTPFKKKQYNTSWWFQPLWKIWVKLDPFPKKSGVKITKSLSSHHNLEGE